MHFPENPETGIDNLQKQKSSSSSVHIAHLEEIQEFAATTRFPSPMIQEPSDMSDDEKIGYISERFKEIMEVLGLDLSDDSLAQTPNRIAKMYVKEIFSGLDIKNFPAISFFENRFAHQEKSGMVFVSASFNSFCEHHFVPMNGTAYVAYIPNRKIIGLSKIPRVVRFFARRPQVQERLTAQIADSLSILLETENIAVSLVAEHFCVIARGVQDSESMTTTSMLRGDFENDASLKREFFDSIQRLEKR